MDPTVGIIRGRKFGGVGFIWRKTISDSVTFVNYEYDWICGLKITSRNTNVLILGVYLPYFCDDNIETYTECLAKIDTIVQESDTSCIFIIGDFNTNPLIQSTFSDLINDQVSESGLIYSDIKLLPEDSFTFISDSWNSTSWIDHCLTTVDANNSIRDMNIMYECVSSDHKPLSFSILVPELPSCSFYTPNSYTKRVNWSKASYDSILNYTRLSRVKLQSLVSAFEDKSSVFTCRDPNCKDKQHIDEISNVYKCIVSSLTEVADCTVMKNDKRNNYSQIPGWNDFVKDAHIAARHGFYNVEK